MKLLYTHPNIMIVENAKNCLAEQGIKAVLKNEYSAGAAGELAPVETWPEIWVQDQHYSKAKQLVDNLNTPIDEEPWQCKECGESNEATFEVCWNCQH